MFDMVMSTLLPQVVNTECQITFSSIKNIDDSAEESIKTILKVKDLVAAPRPMIIINKSIPVSMDHYNLPLLTTPVILFIYGYRFHPTKIHLHPRKRFFISWPQVRSNVYLGMLNFRN